MFDMPYTDRASKIEVESYDGIPLIALATLTSGGAAFMLAMDPDRGEWIVAMLSQAEAARVRNGSLDMRSAVLSRENVERWEGGEMIAIVSPSRISATMFPDTGETFGGGHVLELSLETGEV